MSQRPVPLEPGARVQERFEIQQTLGQGAFGITYCAKDLQRGDLCVLRELAPEGAERDERGVLRLTKLGEASAERLRQRFRQEARRLMRFSSPSLFAVRASFADRGTAYLAREYLSEGRTLAERVFREGPVPEAEVEAVLKQLLSALELLHLQGVLHLDLRPSNVLLAPDGRAFLIDFGEARKWHRDLHRLEKDDPGLPPELVRRGARLLPQSDLYALAATAHFALTGQPFGRDADVPAAFRPAEPGGRLAQALARALQEDPTARPRSAKEFLELAEGAEVATGEPSWQVFDRKALALKQLKFDRRECPACKGVLEEPRPLKPGICPVCREGTIRTRKIVERLCPHCRMAPLKRLDNRAPLAICPLCAEGILHRRRKGWFSKEFVLACAECEAVFEWDEPNMRVASTAPDASAEPGEEAPAQTWRERSGRAEEVWLCTGCGAQYDRLNDGRWKQAVPDRAGRFDVLEPSEWARVAAGLPPEAGNAECDACGADYFLEGDDVALLETRFDPHHFAAHNMGRICSLESLVWIGVGKESGKPGFVCADCETELDFGSKGLELVRTPNPGMARHLGQAMSLEGWHRAAQDLPLAEEEGGFDEGFEIALREGYRTGEIPFSEKDPELLWKGTGKRWEHGPDGWVEAGSGKIEITREHVRMGGPLKSWKVPLAEIERWIAEGDRLDAKLVEGGEFGLELEPVDWTVQLDSGSRTVRIRAGDAQSLLNSEAQQATSKFTGSSS
jgi:hypothetical protein